MYGKKEFLQDVSIGVIIALVSIPIGMGYTSVAGLPVVYGLYGSLLPIAVFGLLSSSPRFVFGVDAAPAALVGALLSSFGIAFESVDALSIVPLVTFLVSLWLFVFFLLHADRLLKFISEPVMGGFITGIGTTIILMQFPKLFGGTAGTGEVVELIEHIVHEARAGLNVPSFVLGLLTVAVILTCKKFVPSLPVQPLLMFAGAGIAFFFHIERFGIKMLPPVDAGLPHLFLPPVAEGALFFNNAKGLVVPSFSIAVVILSETLLATSNIALKKGDRINARREILAYSLGNFVSALTGSCPVNGSVSRTGIANQLGVKSQVMSLSAAFAMLLILLFATGFISYLPVPVLTAIVIAALIGTFEFSLAYKLRKVDTAEFFIFYAAFFSVLFFGTVYGVVVGVFLSFITFIIRQSKPATDFMGAIPGKQGYYSLRNKDSVASPIKDTVIYRFCAPLFYANVGLFCSELEGAVTEKTRIVVVDASGISSVDATAAERLLLLYRKFKEGGKKFYIAGHTVAVNDQLRAFGAGLLILERVVRPRLAFALADAGLQRPFPVEGHYEHKSASYSKQMMEFEWAFGSDAKRILLEIAHKICRRGEAVYDDGRTIDMQELRREASAYVLDFWDEETEEELSGITKRLLRMIEDEESSCCKGG